MRGKGVGASDATWTLLTPTAAGAIAIIQIKGDVDGALAACGVPPVGVGEIRLRDICGIDRGIVARLSVTDCQLIPHGGVAVVRGVCRVLSECGVRESDLVEPTAVFPEARSEVEARARVAITRAASPLAVDLLLQQHDLWRTVEPGMIPTDADRDRVLKRLIDPPLVMAVGASNIGKSTLVNALAGRSVSIVSGEPGTTRDHVGVHIELDGLVVRYVDTPGLRADADAIEEEAVRVAMELAAMADLVLLCGDVGSGLPEWPRSEGCIRVALREDLGRAAFAADARISVTCGTGIVELTSLIRERLVPAEYLDVRGPWRFWD